jgi:hypothetical protein
MELLRLGENATVVPTVDDVIAGESLGRIQLMRLQHA